jgi:para-nitrobenzyl esterase
MDRRTFLGVSGGAIWAAMVEARLRAQAGAAAGPVVEVQSGRLRGVSNAGVQIFKGIPYGAAPTGPRRFLPAVAPAPWTGVLDATEYGRRFYQPFRPMIPEVGDNLTGSGPMSEDALRLNVWTPATGQGRRPVMIWSHGGGQRTGSGNSIFYDGADLARKHDVVVVTTTHRLNAFAYLWLAGIPGTGERFADSANLGVRDIALALRWVRDNIGQFGGDPGNVTIFGQSGGGGKTAMLTALPEAKGLFHRAIIMSTLYETAVRGDSTEDAVEVGEELLGRLGIRPADAARLQDLPPERIIDALTGGGAAGGQSGQSGPPRDLSLRFVPVVDGKTLPAHPFEPASPFSADIPIMTGSNECEGIPYGNPNDAYWTTIVTTDAELRDRAKRTFSIDDAEADRVIALYKSHRPDQTNDELAAVMSGDNSNLRYAGHTIAERKHAQGRAPVYLYQFNWRSPLRNGRLRSMHGMELPFVFNHPDLISFMTGNGPERAELAEKMSGAFAAFARTGNPNYSGIPRWDAWTPDRFQTMVFDREIKAENDPFGEIRRTVAALRARRGVS